MTETTLSLAKRIRAYVAVYPSIQIEMGKQDALKLARDLEDFEQLSQQVADLQATVADLEWRRANIEKWLRWALRIVWAAYAAFIVYACVAVLS